MKQFYNNSWLVRLTSIAVIACIGFLVYLTGYAQWTIRLAMCTVFCSIIYLRDQAESGRWIAIGIIMIGTLLSLLWELNKVGGFFVF